MNVLLGSETLETFNETDGRRVFARIENARAKLEGLPFVRNEFFESKKTAVGWARVRGLDRDGKVPVRTLYALLVLVRQSQDEAFMKRPGKRSFKEYSICEFIYDLARFGKQGWSAGSGGRLASQTPNMATVAKGAAITLPALDGAKRGTQLATLWIERA